MAQESGAALPVAAAALPEGEVEEQGVEVTPSKKRKTTPATKEEMFGDSQEQWVQARDVQLSLDDLEVGVGLTRGQVRPLSEDTVKQRLANLQQVPPDRPVDVTVWNPSMADPSMFPFSVVPGLPTLHLPQRQRRPSSAASIQ